MRASPPHRDADATRQRLLRAAIELFTAQGFRATTTPLIAARAQLAEGTIYRHFRGKDVLFNETRRRSVEWATGVIRDLSAERQPPRETLTRIGRRLAEGAQRDAAVVRMALAAPNDGPAPDEACRLAVQAFRGALELIVAGGKSDGVIRPGPAELWCGIWLAVVRYCTERVAAGEWAPDHPQVTLTLDAAWDAIAARATAASPESTSAPPG